ncbi:MAG: SDR family oxidoreductase [Proteobacteria bacterium]|nr:SDR family oxidoreductase [Pseudomonadota bacterium]
MPPRGTISWAPCGQNCRTRRVFIGWWRISGAGGPTAIRRSARRPPPPPRWRCLLLEANRFAICQPACRGSRRKIRIVRQLIEHSRIASFRVPIRSGEKSEIAKLAVFLCSEDAGYIIGQTIVADGGTTSLMSLISDFRAKSTATFGKGYVPGL